LKATNVETLPINLYHGAFSLRTPNDTQKEESDTTGGLHKRKRYHKYDLNLTGLKHLLFQNIGDLKVM